jgi:mannose-1-phosphate guanylyltransferase
VGNIDNCHLSKQVLEKSKTDYIDIIESTKHRCGYCFAAFASGPDDILIVTPSDHIIGGWSCEASIQEAIAKAATVYRNFGIIPQNLKQAMGISNAKGMTSFPLEKNQIK